MTFQEFQDEKWKTAAEISSATGITQDNVTRIVMNYDEFVQSSSKGADGTPRFTTKEMFRKNESFVHKMIGAFKNRID